MVRKVTFLLGIIFLLANGEIIAADFVGTIIAVQGKVYATNEAGVERLLQRHDKFQLREIITTQEDSIVQLKLRDDTIISLKPNTKYSVDQFNLDTKNPKNNRYVGKLIEGVLISLSGEGKNSTHDNHLLQTPAVTIAVRGTLFEGGFKAKKYSACKTIGDKSCCCDGLNNKAINKLKKGCHCNEVCKNPERIPGIGWVSVENGAVAVVGGGKKYDLTALDLSNNSCFIVASCEGVTVTPMGGARMRESIAAKLAAIPTSNVVGTIPPSDNNMIKKIIEVPAPTIPNVITPTPPGPEPFPNLPQFPGRPTDVGEG